MKIFIGLAISFFILGCDGYYRIRKDVVYREPVPEECIKKAVTQNLLDARIGDSKETSGGQELHITWKDKEENRPLRGLLIYSKDRRSIQIEAYGITPYFPEIKKREGIAAKELDSLIGNLKLTCNLNAVSIKTVE